MYRKESNMGRQPNIRINGELLDKHIKEIEGEKFDASKISTFILGRDKTYYKKCLLQNSLAEDVLDRVCKYYELTKDDYIITEEKVKETIQQKADTMNYDNVILLLQGIDTAMKELLAQQKTTNYYLKELYTNSTNDTKLKKEILQKLENMEKRDKRGPSYAYKK